MAQLLHIKLFLLLPALLSLLAMSTKTSSRIFDVVVAYLAGDSFSAALTPQSALDRRTLSEIDNELSVDYTVPAPLCRVGPDASDHFSVSAVLALLDDFSSYALMMQDRNHRPGVSVTLNTEIVRTCKAGEKIRLISRCDKIGKSIAFLSMELKSASGEVLARGKHIKYVKMGFFWDLLTSALLFPLVLMVLEYLIKSKKPKAKKSTTPDGAGDSTVGPELGGLFKSLNITVVEDPAGLFPIGQVETVADGEKKGKKRRKAVPQFDENERCFSFKVSKATSNVLGAMHGGAVAAAAEEACMQVATADASKKGRYLQTMEVVYISPAKGELVIALRDDEHAAQGQATVGRVISRNTGQVCSEFTCKWSSNAAKK